jgi:predicted negative regulator of RcsB-dependent stress response
MVEELTKESSRIIKLRDNIIFIYKNNKILVLFSIFVLLFILFSTTFYFHSKEKKRLLISDLYITAKINLNRNQQAEAKNNLIKIIESDESTYSPLALFLLIDTNLVKEDKKIVEYFDYILENNRFDEEIKNLIVFKKALVQSNYVDELKLITTLNPLINSDTLWKSHALLLLGDFFYSKNEFIKAKENYLSILSSIDSNNLHNLAKQRLQHRSYE